MMKLSFLAAAAAALLAPALLPAQTPTPVANSLPPSAGANPPPALTPAQVAALPKIPVPTDRPLEYVILSGGPSLEQWEKYKAVRHDNFWGGFIRAARTRVQQLQAQLGPNPNAVITMLVYLDGYRSRGRQDQQDLISNIYSVRDKFRIRMIPIENGKDVMAYLNNGGDGISRDQVKIADFEYFGHSNRCAFMFDYSNNIDSAAKSWLHEDELGGLRRNLFTRNAYVKSWGCHTGESMSAKFKSATGQRMIGAIGRTDYSNRDEALNGVIPVLSSQDGKWVQ